MTVLGMQGTNTQHPEPNTQNPTPNTQNPTPNTYYNCEIKP